MFTPAAGAPTHESHHHTRVRDVPGHHTHHLEHSGSSIHSCSQGMFLNNYHQGGSRKMNDGCLPQSVHVNRMSTSTFVAHGHVCENHPFVHAKEILGGPQPMYTCTKTRSMPATRARTPTRPTTARCKALKARPGALAQACPWKW